MTRADATRNREKVLAAAEAVFAEQGVAVPIDEVARSAGVGVGTVYRHFPTKEVLFEAIVVRHLRGLATRADGLLSAEDPGAAFFGFLSQVAKEATLKRDLTEALSGAGVDLKAAASDDFARLRAALANLLERAQATGQVRADVAVDDVLVLVSGTCMAAGHAAGAPAERLVGLICDGLRAPAEAMTEA